MYQIFLQPWWKKWLILALSYRDIFQFFSNYGGRNGSYLLFHTLIFKDFFQSWWKKWLILAFSYLDIFQFFSNDGVRNDSYLPFHTLIFKDFFQPWWKKYLILALSYLVISNFSPTMVEEMAQICRFIPLYLKIFSNHGGRNGPF